MRTAMIPMWSLAASDLADAEPCEVPDSLQGLQVCKACSASKAGMVQPVWVTSLHFVLDHGHTRHHPHNLNSLLAGHLQQSRWLRPGCTSCCMHQHAPLHDTAPSAAACCLVRHALLHATLQMASLCSFTGSRGSRTSQTAPLIPPAASGASACPLLLQTRACLPPVGGTWSLTSRLCRRSSRCRWAQQCSWCGAKALWTSECKQLPHHTTWLTTHSQQAAILLPQLLGSALHCQHRAIVLHKVAPRPRHCGHCCLCQPAGCAAALHYCSCGGPVLHEPQCPLC